MSASGIDSKRPSASASVMVLTVASARSAATRASFLLRPEPDQAEAGDEDDARHRVERLLLRPRSARCCAAK